MSTGIWRYVDAKAGVFINFSENEKYPILSNGKRYKKDSREWLHKTSDNKGRKKMVKVDKFNNPPIAQEVEMNNDDSEDSVVDQRISTSMVDTRKLGLLGGENGPVSTTYSCTSELNLSRTQKAEMAKRKRHHVKSPEATRHFKSSVQNAVFCEDENANFMGHQEMNDLLLKRYGFTPIQESGFNFRDIERETYPRDDSMSEGFWSCLQEESNGWRDIRRIPSDASSPGSASTPDEDLLRSPVFTPVPMKRHKSFHCMVEYHQQSRAEEPGSENRSPNSEVSEISFVGANDSLDGDAVTPRGSPWGNDGVNSDGEII